MYPSVIDHTSPDANSITAGATAHRDSVRWNQGLNRDLLRPTITFQRP